MRRDEQRIDWREGRRNKALFFILFCARCLKKAATDLLLFTMLIYPLSSLFTNVASPSEKVTIDFSSPIGTSQFSPGINLVDNTLDYPWGNNDPSAINNVKSLIKNGISYEDTSIMAWGVADPWADPSQPEPSN